MSLQIKLSYNPSRDIYNKKSIYQMCGTIERMLKYTYLGSKLSFFLTIVIPILVYGSECWTITKEQQKKIGAVDMEFTKYFTYTFIGKSTVGWPWKW